MATLRPVIQVGLFSTSNEEVETLTKRVTKFNHRFMSDIKLDIQPMEQGDSIVNQPHYKLRLTFPNHQVQEAFWLE